jgi:hypothetical protein
MLSLFLVASAFGYTYYLNSDRTKIQAQFASAIYTADQAAIFTGRGLFQGILVTTDGTNNATVVVYDSVTHSGTQLTPSFVVLGASRTFALSFSPGIAFATGLSVDFSVAGGGSGSYQVFYDK